MRLNPTPSPYSQCDIVIYLRRPVLGSQKAFQRLRHADLFMTAMSLPTSDVTPQVEAVNDDLDEVRPGAAEKARFSPEEEAVSE